MALTLFNNDISGDEFAKKSYSGLPEEYQKTLLDQTIPQFLDSLANYDKNIDDSTQKASDLYESQIRNTMSGGVQDMLNSLSNKGTINSKMGGDALGQMMFDIVNSGAEKTHEAALTGSQLKANKPTLLGSAVNLGQSSETRDPLAPYTLLADLYKSMM